MRSRYRTTARAVLTPLALGVALAAAGCGATTSSAPPAPGSSSSSLATSPATPAQATSSSAPAAAAGGTGCASTALPSLAAEPATGGGAKAAITRNWEHFFAGSTSAGTKIGLLENGQSFAPVINAQACSPLSKSAKAAVSAVTISGHTASVSYSIGISGVSLGSQHGTAVYGGGVWKVSDRSFCALLTMENAGKKPAVCTAAG